MASSNQTNRHFPRNPTRDPISIDQTRSYTHFLCKSLFFAVFLIALPLFPSQAPDFINRSVITTFWELGHLFFFGIAVVYGLFSSRNVDANIDFKSDVTDANSFVSKMFLNVPFVFENGNENSCGFELVDDSDLISRPNPNLGSKIGDFVNTSEYVNFRNGIDYESADSDSNAFQSWNAKYSKRESIVVVAQPNCGLDEYFSHKPLGLPVRSLKSNVDTSEFSNEIESSSTLKCTGSSFDSSNGSTNMEFDELEQKLHEEMSSGSAIPLCSRSERTEVRGNDGYGTTRSSHFRPFSADESQFETLKSGSESRLDSSNSVSSESSNFNGDDFGNEKSLHITPSNSSNSSRPMSHSRHFSYESLLEEDGSEDISRRVTRADVLGKKDFRSRSLKSEVEEQRRERDFHNSYLPTSPTAPAPSEGSPTWGYKYVSSKESRTSRNELLGRKDKGSRSLTFGEKEYGYHSSCRANSWHDNRDSLFEKDDNTSDESDRNGKVNSPSSSSELRSVSLKWEPNRSNLTKSSSRGKSVRTVRSNGGFDQICVGKFQADGRVQNEISGHKSLGTKSKSLDDKKRGGDQDNRALNSEGEASADGVSDEVDRKADEFIAKFREQIRLQKTSVETPKGLNVDTSSYFR